jgi:NRE family putative nickel resistance protein-like MFS transporter
MRPVPPQSLSSVNAGQVEDGGFTDVLERGAPDDRQRSFGAIFQLPRFRLLWGSQLAGSLGEAVAQVALPLYVYQLSGSARLLGLFFVLQTLPRVILAPVAGLLADRLDRRRLMLVADVGRAVTVAALPFTEAVSQVAVLAALVAVGTAIARPAELAAVPMVAGPRLLVSALALVQVSNVITRIIGPALGAGIVATAGPAPAFWVQMLCFVVSASLVWRLVLPSPEPRSPVTDGSGLVSSALRTELLAGLRVVWFNCVVRGITAAEVLWQVVGTVFVIGLVVYTEETISLGEHAGTVFALLMATISAGAATGAIAGGRLEHRIGRRRLLAIGYFGPLFLLPIGVVPPLAVLAGCLFALGFLDAWAVIAMQAYLAQAVPDALRGRMYAAWSALITLAGALWYGAVGWVIPLIGAPRVFVLAGLIVGIGAPASLWLTGALTTLRHDVKEPGHAPVLGS